MCIKKLKNLIFWAALVLVDWSRHAVNSVFLLQQNLRKKIYQQFLDLQIYMTFEAKRLDFLAYWNF